MTCEALFQRMGFECRERAPGVFRVFTPMSLSDGEPISLYIVERDNTVRVSDNGNTLFHMRGIGLDLDDRKKWKGVSNIVSSFKLDLEHSGEVCGMSAPGNTSDLVSRYIGAMLAIADLEREIIGITPETSDYIDEVETHLKLWRPDENFTRDVSIAGHSGRSHKFHFMQGKDLIDAARPVSQSTGAILRKAADIQHSATPYSIIVVVDDRSEYEKAKAEMDILGTLVKVLPFSRLAGNLSGAPPDSRAH